MIRNCAMEQETGGCDMKIIRVVVFCIFASALLWSQCQERDIWPIFPSQTELGDVEPPSEMIQKSDAIIGGRSYSMEWLPGLNTRAVNIRLSVFETHRQAESEYDQKTRSSGDFRASTLGDRCVMSGPTSHPRWIILKKRILIEYETFYFPEKTVSDQTGILRTILGRIDHLGCMDDAVQTADASAGSRDARRDAGDQTTMAEVPGKPPESESVPTPKDSLPPPALEETPPAPEGAEPHPAASAEASVDANNFFAVYRPATKMRLVVKGVSAIREGDEVLGGPLDYYSARQLTEGAPTPAPEAEPAVPPATTSIIDGVTRGLVLVMTMDPEIDGLIKGPLGTAGKVHGKPTWLKTPRGWGIEFDGRDDWIMLEPDGALDLRASMTIEVLLKLPQVIREEDLHMMVWRGDEQGGKDPYGFSVLQNYLCFRRDFPKHMEVMWPLKDVEHDRFHLFCAVHRAEEGMMELWIDGKKVSAGRVKEQMKYKTINMTTEIGSQDNGKSQFFRGIIDEIRIYNRALTAEEITTEAQALLR